MSGQPQPAPALAALLSSRARRLAVTQRRTRIIVGVMSAIWVGVAVRSTPRPGLHGTPLVIGVAIVCFVATLVALNRLGSPFVPQPGVQARAYLPVLALLALSSGTLLFLQPSGPGSVGPFLVVMITGRHFSRHLSGALFVVVLAFLAVLDATKHKGWTGLTGVVGLLVLFAVYGASLLAVRVREQEHQEERLLAELEERRDADLRAAALAERQRLAREMHDVLAHSLSGLVVQLEGTRLLAATAPGDPRLPAAIDRAHQLARSGLDEARQAIGMLRDDELPGPGRLGELASSFTVGTGVPCRFTESGPPRDLPPAVRLALYRVTQEGLTNVRKHARPDRVEVRFEYQPETVTLTVQDFGADPAVSQSDGCGYGLTGMRERAGLLGGSLDAARTEDGFRVLLQVPA